MGSRVDDREVAKQFFVMCCGKCKRLSRVEIEKVLGRCPHCGYRFQHMRAFTRSELRQFLSGKKMDVHVRTEPGGPMIRTTNGIDSIPNELVEERRRHVPIIHRHAEDLARRREEFYRKEELDLPAVSRMMGRMRRKLESMISKLRSANG